MVVAASGAVVVISVELDGVVIRVLVVGDGVELVVVSFGDLLKSVIIVFVRSLHINIVVDPRANVEKRKEILATLWVGDVIKIKLALLKRII